MCSMIKNSKSRNTWDKAISAAYFTIENWTKTSGWITKKCRRLSATQMNKRQAKQRCKKTLKTLKSKKHNWANEKRKLQKYKIKNQKHQKTQVVSSVLFHHLKAARTRVRFKFWRKQWRNKLSGKKCPWETIFKRCLTLRG